MAKQMRSINWLMNISTANGSEERISNPEVLLAESGNIKQKIRPLAGKVKRYNGQER